MYVHAPLLQSRILALNYNLIIVVSRKVSFNREKLERGETVVLVALVEKWGQCKFFSSTFLPSMLMQTTSVPRREYGTSARPKSKAILDSDCFSQPISFPGARLSSKTSHPMTMFLLPGSKPCLMRW